MWPFRCMTSVMFLAYKGFARLEGSLVLIRDVLFLCALRLPKVGTLAFQACIWDPCVCSALTETATRSGRLWRLAHE